MKNFDAEVNDQAMLWHARMMASSYKALRWLMLFSACGFGALSLMAGYRFLAHLARFSWTNGVAAGFVAAAVCATFGVLASICGGRFLIGLRCEARMSQRLVEYHDQLFSGERKKPAFAVLDSEAAFSAARSINEARGMRITMENLATRFHIALLLSMSLLGAVLFICGVVMIEAPGPEVDEVMKRVPEPVLFCVTGIMAFQLFFPWAKSEWFARHFVICIGQLEWQAIDRREKLSMIKTRWS